MTEPEAAPEPASRRFGRWLFFGAPIVAVITFVLASASSAGIISVAWTFGYLVLAWISGVVGTWLEQPIWGFKHLSRFSTTLLAGFLLGAGLIPLGFYEARYIEEHAPPPPPPPYVAADLPSAISLFMETNAVDGATIIDCAAMDIRGPYFGLLKYQYFFRTSYDARTNALFVTYYIPAHPILAHDDNMLKIMGFVASQTEHQIGVGKQFFNGAFAGEPNKMSSADFRFTGRVYMYFDDLMTLDQKAKLEKIFRDQGMILDLRGPDFAATMQAEMIAQHNPSVPEYRIVSNNMIEPIPGTGTPDKLRVSMQKTAWRAILDPGGEQCIPQLPGTELGIPQ